MHPKDQSTLQFKPQKSLIAVLKGVWIVFAVLIIVFSYSLQSDVSQPEEHVLMNYWYVITGGLMFVFGLYIYNSSSKKLIIDGKALTYQSFLKKRVLPLSEIKGVRKVAIIELDGTENQIRPLFIPKRNSQYQKISTFHNKELGKWATAHFIDLDNADYEQEVAEIHADKTLGDTIEERNEKFRQADIIRNSISVVGLLLILISIFYDIPRYLCLYYITISSIVILFGLVYYRGLFRMEWGTARIGISHSVLIIFLNYTIVSQDLGFVDLSMSKTRTMLLNSSIFIALLCLIYIFGLIGASKYKFKKIWMTFLLFATLVFSNKMTLNIILDQSEAKLYSTSILEYYEDSYRGITYTYKMRLQKWNSEGGKYNEVKVSRHTYRTISPGTLVEIKEYSGVFGEKWFTVHLNGKELNEANSYFGRNQQIVPWEPKRP